MKKHCVNCGHGAYAGACNWGKCERCDKAARKMPYKWHALWTPLWCLWIEDEQEL